MISIWLKDIKVIQGGGQRHDFELRVLILEKQKCLGNEKVPFITSGFKSRKVFKKLVFFLFTARLRGVHDGLFTGQIDAVDTSAATYRVTFDRSGLGTHTVPDYEVLVSPITFRDAVMSVFVIKLCQQSKE